MFEYNKEQNLLTVNLPEGKSIPEILLLAEKELEGLNPSVGFNGPLLKVTGRCPVALAFVISHHVSHLFGIVAIYSPSDNGFVVTQVHAPGYTLGQVIKDDDDDEEEESEEFEETLQEYANALQNEE
jgi:CRISPR-associated protein Csx3